MLFSATTEYAVRGLSELAKRPADQYVMLDDLVLGTDLPRGFLAKVFQVLVKGGILRSHKGRGGGFMLARHPGEITLIDIVDVVEGRSLLGIPTPAGTSADAGGVGADPVASPSAGVTTATVAASADETRSALYGAVGRRLREYLGRTTLADVLDAERKAQREKDRAQRQQKMGKRPRLAR